MAYGRDIAKDGFIAGHLGHGGDEALLVRVGELLAASARVLARVVGKLQVTEEGFEGDLLEGQDLGVEGVPVSGLRVGGVVGGGEQDDDLEDGRILHYHGQPDGAEEGAWRVVV